MGDILATDPYFSSSFEQQRYDDFVLQSSSILETYFQADRRLGSNCVMITKTLARESLYSVHFKLNVPQRGTAPNTWLVPLSYRRMSGGALGISVRGHKYGQTCSISSSLSIPFRASSLENSLTQLCRKFVNWRRNMWRGDFSDFIVLHSGRRELKDKGHPFFDDYLIDRLNKTFIDQWVTDGRAVAFDLPKPRLKGVGDTCSACVDGEFTDCYTGQKRRPYDYRFAAHRELSFYGYLMLKTPVRYRCRELFDFTLDHLIYSPSGAPPARWTVWPETFFLQWDPEYTLYPGNPGYE